MKPLSIAERILQFLVDALRPVAASQRATVHRSPAMALRRDVVPALVLFPETETVLETANGRETRELTVRLMALARAVPPMPPEAAADALLSAAHRALFVDLNCGGLALGLRPGELEWDVEEADGVNAALSARYHLTYRCMTADRAMLG